MRTLIIAIEDNDGEKLKRAEKRISDTEYNTFPWSVWKEVPFSEGGPTTLENMRTLCRPCHVEVTAMWRKAKAEAKKKQVQPAI